MRTEVLGRSSQPGPSSGPAAQHCARSAASAAPCCCRGRGVPRHGFHASGYAGGDGSPLLLVETHQHGAHRGPGRGGGDPVGRSCPVAPSRTALDTCLHRRDPCQRLADRRGRQWTRGSGSSSRLDARPAMRLEDGGAIDSSSHRTRCADTAWRTDRPRRDGACRRAVLRGLGAFVFVFACPSDDPLYIAVWSTLGCSIVTILGRTILIRLSRW